MLLAEIHGKRCIEAENKEDWLTSAVFGHLHLVPPSQFWSTLFTRARSATAISVDLTGELRSKGIFLERYNSLETLFWKDCGNYGEPDLLLRFTGPNCIPVVVLIEVKLYASKSGRGEKDQLAKYLRLLDDRRVLPRWSCDKDVRVLVYLTKAFAAPEIRESIEAYPDGHAGDRIFGLQWQDVLEASANSAEGSMILREVAAFLTSRGFAAFRGFSAAMNISPHCDGHFYKSTYFTMAIEYAQLAGGQTGKFYG